MLKLPDVTIIALTNKNFEEHARAIGLSSMFINFGASKIIMDNDCNSIEEWNRKIIYELPKYVFTSHALLVHHDGYVCNGDLWNPNWLKYDWCSSPWPLPTDDFSYRDEIGRIQRVGNSVSLRSKRLMDRVAQFEWKSYHGNTNEDGFICVHHRKQLEDEGFKFLPFEEAIFFGKEAPLPENEDIDTFLFHKYP